MRDMPPGWQTDLAVLDLTGSLIDDRGDHLVVRTPRNPGYHWGNFVFVADPEAVGDAERWVQTFHAEHPEATWVAVGLVRMPDDPAPWQAQGLELEVEDVLSTSTLPTQTPPAPGYTVRRLSGSDWAHSVARSLAENERTGEHEPDGYARFASRQVQARRELSEREQAAFFGAFAGADLVADLGIVVCGSTARYQAVGTDREHRRRGLAAHLLGVAARWSAEQGCNRWVIITEPSNPAGRVYRSVGFEPDIPNAQAYRKSPR
jgi:GNAT superfamily N-acetyltransferase